MPIFKCFYCKGSFKRRGTQHKFCSHKCYSDNNLNKKRPKHSPAIKGKNNGRWKGGITKNLPLWYKHFREKNPKKHKEKARAYGTIAYKVKIGEIIKQPCLVCKNTIVHAHHPYGYNGENKLKIIWLCPKHHQEIHWHPESSAAFKVLYPLSKGITQVEITEI